MNAMNHSYETFSAQPAGPKSQRKRLLAGGALALLLVAGMGAGVVFFGSQAPQAAVAPPTVSATTPLQKMIGSRSEFLGQFAAVDQVDLRAQVGGTLVKIGFKDGSVVHKGDVLFEIDPTPYQIRMSQATARLALARQELTRAKELQRTDSGTVQNVEQRQAEATEAEAAVRDAHFDLDHCRITAPFTGRIGTHLVSVGNLISGSRAGAGPTTLLATIVSLDPIYLNFDMSEADYMAFQRDRAGKSGPLANRVDIALSDEKGFDHQGTLDFIDNTLDRSSGTIHARATVPNSDLLLTPGAFGRVRLSVSKPALTLLVPDAAVVPDQSNHVVLTVGPNDIVTPKLVEVGPVRGGLRVIRSGLKANDRVIIDGIPMATPGGKVTPKTSTIHFGSDQD